MTSSDAATLPLYSAGRNALPTFCLTVRTLADPKLLEHARTMGEHLKSHLDRLAAKHARIVAVRSRGLMAGLLLDGPAAGVVTACREHGLLVNGTADRVVRLTPPLIITRAQLDEAVAILDQALA